MNPESNTSDLQPNGAEAPKSVPPTSSKPCPQCGNDLIQESDACPYCGIIFSKYRQRRPRPGPKPVVQKRGPLGLISMREWARFFERLAKLIDAGLPITQALIKAGFGLKNIDALANRTMAYIEKGDGLVAAFGRAGAVFPSYVWGHLQAGERSGNLVTLLHDLSAEIENRRKWILGQIFNLRTLYLFAIMVFAAASLAFTESVRNLTVEAVDRGSVAVLNAIFLGSIPRFFIFGGLLALGVFAFAWFQIKGKQKLTQRYPTFERLRLRLPLFADILIQQSLQRYLKLLGKLIDSGLPLGQSLTIAREDIDFPHWREQFKGVRKTIEAGGSLADGLRPIPHVPRELVAEVEVAERTGSLDQDLTNHATRMGERTKRQLRVVQTIFLVGTILVGIFLALFVILRGLGAWIPIYEKVLF